MTEAVRPFSNGTQYADWSDSNCARCTKGVHRLNDETAWPTCELEAALLEACFGDGEIPLATAQRIGMRENEGRYVWPCAEVDWTEEWKAEYYSRHPEKKPMPHETQDNGIACSECRQQSPGGLYYFTNAPWGERQFCGSCVEKYM